MTRANGTGPVVYFGKLPSRGDFVRSAQEPQLVHTLDDWLARGMDLLAGDVRWKLIYDEAPPASFAFMGSRSRIALSGHLTPSFDASRRRFPFIAATAVEIDQPMRFIARSPLALSPLWGRLETLATDAFAAAEPTPALDAITNADINCDTRVAALDDQFDAMLDEATIGDLEDWLVSAGHVVSVRRSVIALGLLLQPLIASPTARLDKALVLPLPRAERRRFFVASLWSDLITRFLARSDVEIGLFMGQIETLPSMLVGFNGASARVFQALVDPEACRDHGVSIAHADWIEEWVDQDYALRKLSDYMEQRSLSLRQMLTTFGETFIGA